METWARSGGRSYLPVAIRLLLLAGLVVAAAGALRPAHAETMRRPHRYFWVARSSGWLHVKLDEVAESAHVHLYAPPSARLPQWQATDLVATFEGRTLPTDVRIFGSVAHLTPIDIALVPLDSMTLGYFDQNDVAPFGPDGDPAHSNRANVLFSRLPNAMPDRDKLADTDEVLAHELQHLIEFRARVVQRHLAPEDNWLNEGLSFFAQIVNGYWTPRDALKRDAACGNPSWPVTALNQNMSFLRHNARIAYGRAGLFVTYLAARFGAGMARSLVVASDTGLKAVDEQIHLLDSRQGLDSVFADWGVAQYLHAHGRYGYGPYARNLQSIPLLALPAVTGYPFDSRSLATAPFTLRSWSQAYVQFETRGGQNLEVRIDGLPTGARVAAILEDSTHAFSPRVEWIPASRDGGFVYRLNALADIYDRVTLAINDVARAAGAGGQSSRIRVRARLVNVSDNDRPPRLATAARSNADFALRQVFQLRQSITVRAVHPEAPGIAAGDA